MAYLTVVGLGYVGLPLAREACRVGLTVSGLDVSSRVVDSLMAGRSHVDDVTAADVATMLDEDFTATTDATVLGSAQVIVICVPTPLAADGAPDLGAVRAAGTTVARHLRRETLVVLESTTYPGTTDELLRPILEEGSGLVAGVDFNLAFSPERIDPGNKTYGLHNTPKVVGGHTPGCTAAAAAFYGKLCTSVIQARSTREAELAKLLENTYRHLNIALVNEMAVICAELGIDLWDAISCAATKPFGFQAFYPGPGVGGHCIPVDPSYLSYKARALGHPVRLIELAQEINTRMPQYVVERAGDLLNRHGKPLNGSRVLLLGVTYKPNITDRRESPADPVARRLRNKRADLIYHDPHVPTWCVDDVDVPAAHNPYDEAAAADLTILLQDHSAYDLDLLANRARLLLDTRGRIRHGNAEML